MPVVSGLPKGIRKLSPLHQLASAVRTRVWGWCSCRSLV